MKKKRKDEIFPPIYCKVSNCDRLNIREAPIATSKVVWIANKGDILMTTGPFPKGSTSARLEVYSTDGNARAGYALSDYLEEIGMVEAERSI